MLSEPQQAWLSQRPSMAYWDLVCDRCGCDCPWIADACTRCGDAFGFRFGECLPDCLHERLVRSHTKARRGPLRQYALQLFVRDNGLCVLCGHKIEADDVETTQVDHMVPVVIGGTDDLFNLHVVHASCHGHKTAREAAMRKEMDKGFHIRQAPSRVATEPCR